MNHKKIAMHSDKKIGLVAHDNKKWDLVQWAKFNRDLLARHKVFATGTTGRSSNASSASPSPNCKAAARRRSANRIKNRR